MNRARTRGDHNRFAKRRRLNMREGESLASARKHWRDEDRCRDCRGLLFEDGAMSFRRSMFAAFVGPGVAAGAAAQDGGLASAIEGCAGARSRVRRQSGRNFRASMRTR